MARLAAVGVALAALAAVTPAAVAQPLETLHVKNFSLSVDRSKVPVGEPLHVTISIDVTENLPQIAGIVLPNLAGFDELGDERRCTSAGQGTSCVETLTLEPTSVGQRTLGPATLDAIDARSGKPSRFATNTATVAAVEGGGISGETVRDDVYAFAALIIRIALVLLVVVLGAALVSRLFRARPPRVGAATVPAAPPPPAAAVPHAPPSVAFPELLAALRERPSRENAVALREALRARVGAGDRETMRDLIARRAVTDPREAAGMTALERAAFCPAPEVERYAREATTCLS